MTNIERFNIANVNVFILMLKGEWAMIENIKQEICEALIEITDLDLLDLILKLLIGENG